MTVYYGKTITIEDREKVLLSAIPILPGGMVEVALIEFGASIVDVCRDEAQSLPVLPKTVETAATS